MPHALVSTLTERAASYRHGGPSSEHTAKLLEEAADQIQELHDMLSDLCRDRDERMAIGGGPGWQVRHAKTWLRAEELLGEG